MDASKPTPTGPLHGVVVLDLSRILAGPTATQMLGDLGATVLKIENPISGGDDTRSWGPTYAKDHDGQNTDLSGYFMSSNRNKKSIAVDIAAPQGQDIIRQLAARADIIIENFKPGGLAKYGLDHATLCAAHPDVVYCSISGFGQTGPNSHRPGYDLMAQGFGGVMSLTGEPDGQPLKVGIGIADVMCGMYACIGILAALRHREQTGQGQHIDVALVDTQMAWLINEGTNFLTSGQLPERRGNSHPNIVPYDAFPVSDGHILLAVGNDAQFQRLCDFLQRPDLGQEVAYATNLKRIENRVQLTKVLSQEFAQRAKAEVLDGLEARNVPAGPINNISEALQSDQAKARDAVVNLPKETIGSGSLNLLGNPLKFSLTPVTYRSPPPHFGENTDEVLDQFEVVNPKP